MYQLISIVMVVETFVLLVHQSQLGVDTEPRVLRTGAREKSVNW